jgi:dipeptidase E
MEPDNPLLDDYLLALTGASVPRVCFIPTASGDADGYIERFEKSFADRAETSVLSLFRRSGDLAELLAEQDAVYVGGGSTANLLALWRLHGLDRLLVEAGRRGTVLAGISAGMNCWFEGSVTDSFGTDPLLPLADGLGLVPGSACPHYDGEPLREPTYRGLVATGALDPGYAVDDCCALLFEDGVLQEAVSSRPGARAFRVVRVDGESVEEPLAVRYLGDG